MFQIQNLSNWELVSRMTLQRHIVVSFIILFVLFLTCCRIAYESKVFQLAQRLFKPWITKTSPPIRDEDLFFKTPLCVGRLMAFIALFGRKRLPNPAFCGHMIKNNF